MPVCLVSKVRKNRRKVKKKSQAGKDNEQRVRGQREKCVTQKRGFKYLGSVTVYAHLQACGLVNDHVEGCFRYREVMDGAETARKRRDTEG